MLLLRQDGASWQCTHFVVEPGGSAGVAGYPEQVRDTALKLLGVNCGSQAGKGLGYCNMIGETDTIKSVNEKYLEIGELAPVMRRNNMIPKKGSEEKLFGQIQSHITSPCMHSDVCLREPFR